MQKKSRTKARGVSVQMLEVGESATFTTDLTPGDTRAGSYFARQIGSYCIRHCPGSSFSYETFTGVTARNRPIVGVIVTRLSGESKTHEQAMRQKQFCKKCKQPGHYAKTCKADEEVIRELPDI